MKKKTSDVPPFYNVRKGGWARLHERMVVIEVRDGQITIKTGFICSTPTSHSNVDNITRTIVWGDKAWNPLADDADDAHERSFLVDDPCLLKRDEVEFLKNPEFATAWFANAYPAEVARKISRTLATTDIDKDYRDRAHEAAILLGN